MSIVTRRNALVGWLAWNVAKRVIARKAKQVVPAFDTEARRPNRPAIIAALATLGIGAWLVRHYLDQDEGEEEQEEEDGDA